MNDQQRRIIAFLEKSGASHIHVELGARHPRIVFNWQGKTLRYVVPGTPSDSLRAAHNAIADIKWLIGLQGGAKVIGQRRLRSQKHKTKPRVSAPKITPGKDWSADLIGALSPYLKAKRLDDLWTQFWRNCMRDAGMVSRL